MGEVMSWNYHVDKLPLKDLDDGTNGQLRNGTNERMSGPAWGSMMTCTTNVFSCFQLLLQAPRFEGMRIRYE